MTTPYEMRLRDLWDVLRRRGRIVLGATTIGLALGLAVSLFRPTLYQASVTITLDKVPPVVVLGPPGFVSGPPEASADEIAFPGVPGLVELAKGQPLKEAVLARLTPEMGARTAKAALARLRVKQVRQSPLLQITVDHPNPAVSATTANTVASTLVGMDLQSRRGRATELRHAIEQQLVAAIPRLKATEDALTAFKSRHGDATLATQTTLSFNRLAVLENELADDRMRQQEAQARIEASRARLTSQSQMVPTQWVPSPLIATLENQLATQEIELSSMRVLFTPKHPGIIAAKVKIQETKNRLNELARNVQVGQYGLDPGYQQLIQQLRQDEVTRASYDARERVLTDAIKAYDAQLRQLPAREQEQIRLARAAKQAEDVTQILSEKLQQAQIAEASVGSAIRVVDAARLPATPVRGRWINLLLGTLVGLAAGVGGTFAKEHVDDPLKSADDVESALRIPVLASVPRLKPVDASPDREDDDRLHLATSLLGHVIPGLKPSAAAIDAHRRRSRFAEAFRYLRTNLLSQQNMPEQRPYRTLLVTSPGPGDGKNVVAANLAIALAQVGRRVWLVECDLREPALDRVAALRDPASAPSAGLTELLDRGTSAASLVHRTGVDNLWVLPAGTASKNPSEQLASKWMRALLTTRHARVDVLIAVAPPVLPVTDAAILAPMVDGVILVVNVGVTPREAACKAQQQLQSVGGRVVGAVVTGVPIGGPGAYDNYYATYYHEEPCQAWHFEPDQGRTETTRALPRARDADAPPRLLGKLSGDSMSESGPDD
jgi:succinoglycan biosynthesis transport protein ExoP